MGRLGVALRDPLGFVAPERGLVVAAAVVAEREVEAQQPELQARGALVLGAAAYGEGLELLAVPAQLGVSFGDRDLAGGLRLGVGADLDLGLGKP